MNRQLTLRQKLISGAALLVALALLIAVPQVLRGYWVRVATGIAMYTAITQALNIIVGYTGYAAFGNVVYFGLGAYATAVAMTQGHLPFPVALAVGGLICAAYALLLGLPILRLRGHYFAMATLGVSLGTREVITNLAQWTGGGKGLTLPIMSAPPRVLFAYFYYLMLGVAIAATLVSWAIAHSRWGYGLIAIREDEDAARVMGVSTTRYKVLAWAVSALLTGLVGGIYGYWQTFLEPGPMFDILIMLKAFTMLLLGGMGTVIGPLLGAVILEILSEVIWGNFLKWHLGILGIAIMIITLLVPGGLVQWALPQWQRLARLVARPAGGGEG